MRPSDLRQITDASDLCRDIMSVFVSPVLVFCIRGVNFFTTVCHQSYVGFLLAGVAFRFVVAMERAVIPSHNYINCFCCCRCLPGNIWDPSGLFHLRSDVLMSRTKMALPKVSLISERKRSSAASLLTQRASHNRIQPELPT